MSKLLRILIAGASLIILAGGIAAYKKVTTPSIKNLYTQAPGNVSKVSTGIAANPITLDAWNTFQSYLAAAHAHDVKALSTYTYKLSDACTNPQQQAECTRRMDAVYAIGSAFKESDFLHAVYDARQIILYSNWKLEENNMQIGYGRSLIYFARDKQGKAHVVFFTQPEETIYSFIDPKQTHAQLVSRLNERIADSDGDTLEDEYETCAYGGATSSGCIKTDPHKFDTNGDGWWDSMEPYLPKQ